MANTTLASANANADADADADPDDDGAKPMKQQAFHTNSFD